MSTVLIKLTFPCPDMMPSACSHLNAAVGDSKRTQEDIPLIMLNHTLGVKRQVNAGLRLRCKQTSGEVRKNYPLLADSGDTCLILSSILALTVISAQKCKRAASEEIPRYACCGSQPCLFMTMQMYYSHALLPYLGIPDFCTTGSTRQNHLEKMSLRQLSLLALLSLFVGSACQFVVRRDEGDIVYTSEASWNHCGRIGGYCAGAGGCDYCNCNFRRTYTSNTGRCEEYYTGECCRRCGVGPFKEAVRRAKFSDS